MVIQCGYRYKKNIRITATPTSASESVGEEPNIVAITEVQIVLPRREEFPSPFFCGQENENLGKRERPELEVSLAALAGLGGTSFELRYAC